MSIKGVSDIRRLPRLGKIRLGIKETSSKTGNEYPKSVDYFVCPLEVQAVYGEKPRMLDIVFPAEDIEDIDGFIKLMNGAGLDPRPYLATNGIKMKKLWNDQRIANELAAMAVDKSTTVFRSKKGGYSADES